MDPLSILLRDDSRLPSRWRARPRSFAALMTLYESNHRRLQALVGDLESLSGERHSHVAGDCELVLRVGERSAFTTDVELTYAFDVVDGRMESRRTAPDMQLRIYHDAQVCEAVAWAPTHGHTVLRGWRHYVQKGLDQRWARNVMLNKWLDYCLERGHSLR